ncbi:hypothetical protein [Psychromonas sp. MME2]|uniref:hypothetical protein n=1 Tax=unclassified Psychromonas TaxID=2614957 RepID=UPI00339CF57F
MDSHIMQKIEVTLITLFMSFDGQQLEISKQNIMASQRKLSDAVQQLLLFMQQKEIGYEPFLSSKCQPIIDFQDAPLAKQQALFLCADKLYDFFNRIPLVEAHVLNNKIHTAQQIAQQNKQSTQLQQTHIVEFSHYKKPLSIAEVEKIINLKQFLESNDNESYRDYFYQLHQGELALVTDPNKYQKPMLLYSELSPLQQLTAQQLVNGSRQKKAIMQ